MSAIAFSVRQKEKIERILDSYIYPTMEQIDVWAAKQTTYPKRLELILDHVISMHEAAKVEEERCH